MKEKKNTFVTSRLVPRVHVGALAHVVDVPRDYLKDVLKLSGHKHPTSGMLAIDHFVNQKNVQLPVYIHGFDFFQGDKSRMHYYEEKEPLYERVNNRFGVNMHKPLNEKIYVQKLIDEGKVAWLKDAPRKK